MTISDVVLNQLNNFDDGISGWEVLEDAHVEYGYATKSWSNDIEGTRVIRIVYVDIKDVSTFVEYSSQYSEIESQIIPENTPYFTLTSKGAEHPAFEIEQGSEGTPEVRYKVDESDVHEFQVMELPWISYVVKAVYDRFEPVDW